MKVLLDKAHAVFNKNKSGQVVSLIDTTGVIKQMDETYPQLTVLITKNTLYFRPPNLNQFLGMKQLPSDNKIFTHSFSQENNGLFSGKNWITSSGFLKLKTLVKTLILPCIILFYLIIQSPFQQ